MINLGIGMLRIKRLESATDDQDSHQSLFALEDTNGFVTKYQGFSSMSTDLRRRFVFNHEDLKVARFALSYDPHQAFELDAARVVQASE